MGLRIHQKYFDKQYSSDLTEREREQGKQRMEAKERKEKKAGGGGEQRKGRMGKEEMNVKSGVICQVCSR